MEARELRIGNYVYWVEKSIPHEIKLISEHNIHTKPISLGDNIKDYKPIPLTEEWFLNFGAEKQIYEDDVNDYYCIIRHKQFDIIYEDNDTIYCDIVGEIFMLKYVHQLQNLYFALTGEELKIK